MAERRFYVVWNGHSTGIFESWDECRTQTAGCPGALYKSFATRQEAERAYASHPSHYIGQKKKTAAHPAAPQGAAGVSAAIAQLPPACEGRAIAVDAACSGNPGQMEYRGVDLSTGQQIFHFGPCYGTNNIGEFLAIVHALALLKKYGSNAAVYSDSRNALLWVKGKTCKTKLPRDTRTEALFALIERGEKWLHENSYANPLLKWETAQWGEIPADFGRK